MSWKLAISPEAHEDIECNAVWWAQHHSIPQAIEWQAIEWQAIEWQAIVYQQLRTIPVMPESYSLALVLWRAQIHISTSSICRSTTNQAFDTINISFSRSRSTDAV